MRTRRVLTITVVILSIGLFLLTVTAWSGDRETLDRAKTLFEQKDFIGSAQLLEKVKNKTAEMIY